MGKRSDIEVLKFEEIYCEKCDFYTSKKPVDVINDANIENTCISNKYYVGEECFKWFIGYMCHIDHEIKPLLIKEPKLSWSVKILGKIG